MAKFTKFTRIAPPAAKAMPGKPTGPKPMSKAPMKPMHSHPMTMPKDVKKR